MSVTVSSRVLWTDFPELSYSKNGKAVSVSKPVAKLVMLAIADNADDFGENSYQSFETLATKSSVERRSVIRAVHALIENGYLHINGKSRYGTNDYKVVLSRLGHAPEVRDRVGRPKISDAQVTNLQKIGDSGAIIGDSGGKTGDSESPESSFKRPLNKQSHVSDETKRIVASSPGWAIAAGVEYKPDPELLALEQVRKTWDAIMKTNSPWDRWGSFDKWLLAQEREGRPVEKFCRWFVSEKFRRESVGMWLPDGKGKTGQWSFKMIYPQAFPSDAPQQAAQRELTPLERALAEEKPTQRPPMPEALRQRLYGNKNGQNTAQA
jgi:hypothetical protein